MSTRLPCDGRRQRQAGQRAAVVDQHRAGAAFAAVAAGLGAGQAHFLAQIIEQQHIVGDRVGAVAAVERELKQPGQEFLPLQSALRCAPFHCSYSRNGADTICVAGGPEALPQANSREWMER